MGCKKHIVEIVVGSKIDFDLVMKADGRPFDFTPYVGGNLVFLNELGVRTVVALPIPGSSAKSGVIAVGITATATADADSFWANADLELTGADTNDSKVIPISDKFLIVPRNAPPVVP